MEKRLFNQLWDLIDRCIECTMCKEIEHICMDHYQILSDITDEVETIINHYKGRVTDTKVSGL